MTTQTPMTKFLLFTNVLFAVALIWTGVKLYQCAHTRSAIISMCPPNCYTPPAACDTMPRFSLDLATQMVRNYRDYHWTAINKNCPKINNPDAVPGIDPKIDSRSVWYSLDTLKMFINTIETRSCGANPKLKLGIRMYFAEYPTETATLLNNNIPEEYGGMHTLLLIPTYRDPVKGINIDFDPNSIDKSTGAVSSIFDAAAAMPPGTMITAMDHGGLAPPPYRVVDCWNNSGSLFVKYIDQGCDRFTSATLPTGL